MTRFLFLVFLALVTSHLVMSYAAASIDDPAEAALVVFGGIVLTSVTLGWIGGGPWLRGGGE